jgi:hypothetical protein
MEYNLTNRLKELYGAINPYTAIRDKFDILKESGVINNLCISDSEFLIGINQEEGRFSFMPIMSRIYEVVNPEYALEKRTLRFNILKRSGALEKLTLSEAEKIIGITGEF